MPTPGSRMDLLNSTSQSDGPSLVKHSLKIPTHCLLFSLISARGGGEAPQDKEDPLPKSSPRFLPSTGYSPRSGPTPFPTPQDLRTVPTLLRLSPRSPPPLVSFPLRLFPRTPPSSDSPKSPPSLVPTLLRLSPGSPPPSNSFLGSPHHDPSQSPPPSDAPPRSLHKGRPRPQEARALRAASGGRPDSGPGLQDP
ncbi:proline-rich protein 2-like [Vombatus ursinus]|uniref:proline-rich protein 2-like n=1 Tax=Vombatus ursinus TaxID=29139 RepID=UPI000FFCF644|nr:proline-rich protein 2-like [Vombatus ursinus]